MSDLHPPDESLKSLWGHVIIPAAIAAIAVLVSLCLDLAGSDALWFQRSGSVMAAVGGYIAFHESRQFLQTIDRGEGSVSAYFNPEISYKWVALAYVVFGTAIWGYGDLPFA